MKIKKLLAALMAITLIGGAVNAPPQTTKSRTLTASAEVDDNGNEYTEGTYESLIYRKYADYIEISDCDKSIAGDLIIPDKIEGFPVKSIKDHAFWECNDLESIIIPDGVTTIGNFAFSDCDSLISISIPDSVTTIGKEVISLCSSIESITIPESVTSMGYGALSRCSLTSATINGRLTNIEEMMFYCCMSLTSVTIPDSVTSIGKNAFGECEKLESINIPDGVTSIGTNAFMRCYGFTEVTIPASVTSIEKSAFCNCAGLTSITILNPDCTIFDSDTTICSGKNDNDAFTFNGIIRGYEGSTAQAYAEKYGYKFEAIEHYTEGTYEDLTYVKYEDRVEIVLCKKTAESVVIPDEIEGLPVTRIDHFAFINCNLLKSVTIPDSVTSIGNVAFSNTGLTEITIPDSVKNIGEIAFSECSDLTSVKLPDNLTEIANGLFQNCKSLYEVNIPDGVESIGSSAFWGCKKLEKVTLPDGVTSIGARAFRDCGSLVRINIPDSVTSIEERAFIFCEALPSIEIPESVTHIEDSTFAWCSALREVKLPDNMTSIGEEAFRECTSLKTIRLPENLTVIDEYTFVGCTALEEVIIPERITGIEKCAFLGCTGLKEITIPENISAIAESAFRDCASLEAITILNPDCDIYDAPATISWIYEVDKDGSVTAEGFGGTIYGYEGSTAQAYAEKYGYKFEAIVKEPEYTEGELGIIRYRKYSDHIEITNGGSEIPEEIEGLPVTVIASRAFYQHLTLTEITIPKTVTKIGSWAFSFCRDLEKVTILNPDCEIYDDNNTFFNVINNAMYGFFNGTIYGYEGSTAQAYAEKYGRKFESLGEAPDDKGEYTPGDANLDGEIDIADAVLIMQCISNPNKYGVNGTEKTHITAQGYKNADCSGGGDGVTNGDALAIQMYLVGLLGNLPE